MPSIPAALTTQRLADAPDLARQAIVRTADKTTRASLGQFMTPPAIARFMASLFEFGRDVSLLDAGAGLGSLTAATIEAALQNGRSPASIRATCYEVDPALCLHLRDTLRFCEAACQAQEVNFEALALETDFVAAAEAMLLPHLQPAAIRTRFTHAILNPPYRKLNANTPTREALSRVGLETSNLYAAFLGLAVLLLDDGGQLVAITPRSFCNGPYFRPFRELLLSKTALTRIHVFESRIRAFARDEVLQETVIVHAVKAARQRSIVVSSSEGPDDLDITERCVAFADVVRPGDPLRFIHLVPNRMGQLVSSAVESQPCHLSDLGVMVSTGRVVDFRAREHLRQDADGSCWPLIYPTHFCAGRIAWPKRGKKPNGLARHPDTEVLLVPSGNYLLVKRFTSKEERRRVVAALFEPTDAPAKYVGFENHLNVFHLGGKGIERDVAVGLGTYLNSTLVDTYLRQFNGHTQVNATDLRALRYPTRATLALLGRRAGSLQCSQDEVDRLIEGTLGLGEEAIAIEAEKKIKEAIEVLRALRLPKQQQSERSALTLLALLQIRPRDRWSNAKSPRMGLNPIVEFIREHYGKEYQSTSRDTVRRQSIRLLRDTALVLANPDEPRRSPDSPNAVYQIEESALELLRTYGSLDWDAALGSYLRTR